MYIYTKLKKKYIRKFTRRPEFAEKLKCSEADIISKVYNFLLILK